MPITALDPKTALILIDLQHGIVASPLAHPIATVIERATTLATAFRAHGLPVVLVNVVSGPRPRAEQPRPHRPSPPGSADLIPELNRQPQDHLVTKHTPGAFTKTDLEAYLRAHAITQVVVAGVATSNGVEVTARQAYELGFNIAFPTDAMTDRAADAHEYSLTRVFPRIGETGTAADIIALLKQSA